MREREMEKEVRKFCENCGKEQKAIIKEIEKEFVVKDETIKARITLCECEHCHEEIWDEVLEKENEAKVFSLYRKKVGFLSSEQIKAIRKRYGLSQKMFSILLGFGSKTITRYENNSLQDESHNLLMKLMNDPVCFLKVWEERKYLFSSREISVIQEKVLKSAQ